MHLKRYCGYHILFKEVYGLPVKHAYLLFGLKHPVGWKVEPPSSGQTCFATEVLVLISSVGQGVGAGGLSY